MIVCCCTPPPPPCTVDVTVEDCAGSGIAGATVTVLASGTTVASGTTDGSGSYTVTISSGTCPNEVVVGHAGLTSTAGLTYVSGVATVVRMYGTGTAAASIVDYDSGSTVASHTTTIAYLGAPISPDTTGGIPLGFWSIAGWTGNFQGVSDGGTTFNYLGDDDTYYRVCSPNFALYCNDSRTLSFRACSTATWNMAACQVCGTDTSGNRVGAIPHTLHATYANPSATLGTDDGANISLVWDSTSWNGDSFNPRYNSFGVPICCRYYSVRPPNGATYLDGPATVRAYSGAIAYLSWRYRTMGARCDCFSYLAYQLVIGTIGPKPVADVGFAAYGAGFAPIPTYCGGLTYPTAIGWQGHSATVGLVDSNAPNTCGRFSAPADLAGISCVPNVNPATGLDWCGWTSQCTDPYDPTYGEAASAIVTE